MVAFGAWVRSHGYVLPDSSLCQNGKQVEIITKMIFELCYIEAIFQNSRALKTAFLEPPLLLLPHLDDTLSGTQDAGLVHGAGCDDINASLCP